MMIPDWRLFPASAFGDFEQAWDSLNDQTYRLPFQDHEFWRIALKHFGTGNELIAIARRGGETVACAIITRKNAFQWETFGPSQAPLGAWLSATDVDLPPLLASLLRSLPGFALTLGVLRVDSAVIPRPKPSKLTSTINHIQTGHIVWDESFEEYWNCRGRNLKKNMKRQTNYLAREGITTQLRKTTSSEDTARCVDSYGHLESAGWKGRAGSALHPDNAQGAFYRELLTHFARRGESVVYEYFYDSDMVASDLCLRRGDKLTILKTTYDETKSKTSPSQLMRRETVRDMFETDSITTVEFFGKRAQRHDRWTDRFRYIYHINADRWRLLRSLRARRE